MIPSVTLVSRYKNQVLTAFQPSAKNLKIVTKNYPSLDGWLVGLIYEMYSSVQKIIK